MDQNLHTDSQMSVFVCQSGSNGNVVQVRFHHDGWLGQSADYDEPLQNMVNKYEEMYWRKFLRTRLLQRQMSPYYTEGRMQFVIMSFFLI